MNYLCTILILFDTHIIWKLSGEITFAKISNDSIELKWNPTLETLIGYDLANDRNSAPNSKDFQKIQGKNINSMLPSLKIENLVPGLSYCIKLNMLVDNAESKSIVKCFITKPNKPGDAACHHDKYNILVEWNGPKNSTEFDMYRLIVHDDGGDETEQSVNKQQHHWQSANYKFTNMTKRNSYTVKIQTISKNQSSDPIEVKCPTIPEPPTDLKAVENTILLNSFEVQWSPPKNFTDFDGYKVCMSEPYFMEKLSKTSTSLKFSKGIQSGHTYEVHAITVSNGQPSESIKLFVTTPPYRVQNLTAIPHYDSIDLSWKTDKRSTQTNYNIVLRRFGYPDEEPIETNEQLFRLNSLIPATYYTIKVRAYFNGVYSLVETINMHTLPLNSKNMAIPDYTNNYIHNLPSIVPSNNDISKEFQTVKTIFKEFKVEERTTPTLMMTRAEDKHASTQRNIFLALVITMITVLFICMLIFNFKPHLLVLWQKLHINAVNNVRIEDRPENETQLIDLSEQDDLISNIDEKIRIEKDDLIIKDVIGSGEFGKVYSGTYYSRKERTEKDVAIKISKNCNNGTYMDKFLQEALIMIYFEHINVLTLYGVSFDSDGSPLVVLPMMKNGDIRSYLLKDENHPSLKQMIYFALDVANGMQYLSEQHFVHRDLAARNCMLDHDLTVKVADFGLTRDIYDKDYYRSLDKNQRIATKWMAIESLEKRLFNTKSDVWSYGVLVWEILNKGNAPYPCIRSQEILDYIKSGGRLEQTAHCPQVIYDLLIRCWSIEPNQRPTFKQIAKQLGHFIQTIG